MPVGVIQTNSELDKSSLSVRTIWIIHIEYFKASVKPFQYSLAHMFKHVVQKLNQTECLKIRII